MLRNSALVASALMLAASISFAQDVNRQRGVIDFVKPILPDPVLQHSKETYILNGCAYCHGVDLVVRNGEAADLMHSALVGRDQDGELIGAVLRSGIPQTPKQSPMPQFSDLSDQQISDIVRWIHYARQQRRYKEISEATTPVQGNSTAGKDYFGRNCSSCHSIEHDLNHLGSKFDSSALAKEILRPDSLDKPASWRIDQLHDTKDNAARRQHNKLLENYSAQNVADLIAYLRGTQ